MRRALAAALLTSCTALAAMAQDEDPYLWLEDVTGEKPLAWVKEQNAATQPLLEAPPGFKALNDRLLAVFNSKERIPSVQKRGAWLYNFWQDEANPRGLWRRTSFEEYRKPEPKWDVLLDVGRLSEDEKERWVFKGAACLYPEYRRCLVSLSKGGADAVVVREFDVEAKAFVKGGFELPESKGGVAWIDADNIYISRDFGPGTLTRSGYPRVLKQWTRGTPLAKAPVVFEAQETDVGVWPDVENIVEFGKPVRYERIRRQIDTRYGEDYLKRGGKFVRLDTPRDSDVAIGHGLLLVRLRTEWKTANGTYGAGSLIGAPLASFFAGKPDFHAIFEPGERQSLQSFAITRRFLVLNVLDNVKSRIYEGHRHYGRTLLTEVPVPPAATISVSAVERNDSDDYWMTMAGFTEPTTLYLASPGGKTREKLKSLPAFFDAKGLTVSQHEATSKDGTKVPYFLVRREEAKLDGTLPTILYGYGGFEIAMTPSYSATVGVSWLEKGGAWVLANIRGGGEFGPKWHLQARREGREKTHDDFIAVAEDLVKKGITSPKKLGIMGGSQGGLLVGAAFTQRPELFRAVVCTVPLLDMKRYHKLLAGASWMGEYGNPDDPKDWAFISKYSPYQNVSKEKKYPKVLFATTTRDDRVHPGHARKMVARMKEQGHDVLYFENIEGGHGSGSTPAQQAYFWSLVYTFFEAELF